MYLFHPATVFASLCIPISAAALYIEVRRRFQLLALSTEFVLQQMWMSLLQ